MMPTTPRPDRSAAKPTLNTQRYRVILGDTGDPDDEDAWVEHEVRPRNIDSVQAESIFKRYKIGALSDFPVTFTNAQLYGALTRTRAIDPHMSWDEFKRRLVEFEVLEETAETPTQPAPEAG